MSGRLPPRILPDIKMKDQNIITNITPKTPLKYTMSFTIVKIGNCQIIVIFSSFVLKGVRGTYVRKLKYETWLTCSRK